MGMKAKASKGSIREVPSSVDPKEVTTILAEDGVVIIEDLLDPTTVENINKELDPVLSADEHGVKDNDVVGQSRRLMATMKYSPTVASQVANHPLLIGPAEAALGEYTDTLQLSALAATEVTPGEPAQPLHRDDWNWGQIRGRTHPLSIFSVIALSEFTDANGATRFVPGSHLWEDAYDTAGNESMWREGIYKAMAVPRGQYEDLTVTAPMRPGSAVMSFGTTLHGAGANKTTDEYRRGMQIKYCMGWLRTTVNHSLLYPPELAKTLPVETQRLLGYQLEAMHLGMLEEGVDPIGLLRD